MTLSAQVESRPATASRWRPSGRNTRQLVSALFPLVGLAAVIVFFAIVTDGNLVSGRNLLRLLVQALPLLVGAVATTTIFSQNAVDLSMGSVLGLAAVVAAYVSQTNGALAIVAAIAVGAAVGALNGALNGLLRINALILTLAVSFIIRGLLQPLTGYGSVGAGRSLDAFNDTNLKIMTVVVLCGVVYVWYEHSGLGRMARFLGANELAAVQSGIRVTPMRVLGYTVSGIGAAVAGLLTLLRSGAALPATGNMFEFDVIIALVLGGMPVTGGPGSRIRSAVLGALLLTVLTAGMTMWGIDEYSQQITKGVVFVLVLSGSFALVKRDN